jgi:hypothetical protein
LDETEFPRDGENYYETVMHFPYGQMTSKQKSQQLKKEHQEKFLQAYLKEGTIYHACIAAGINRTTHYDWLKDDPGYKKLFDEAYQCYTEILEREADRRAREGLDVPVGFYKGEAGEYVKEFSDTLLIFRVKRRDPAYRDRVDVEHSGEMGVKTWVVDAYEPKKKKRGGRPPK